LPNAYTETEFQAHPHDPPQAPLKICFAHGAYRLAERFALRDTGIDHVEVRSADQLALQLPEADVLVVSGLWKNELAALAGKLKFIQSISAGTDQYDQRPAARARHPSRERRRGQRLTQWPSMRWP
jgi:hypothetical protein